MPSRTACLVHDLEQFGEAAAPAPVVAPALATLPEADGAAYVVEGSTLGGLVLAERFEAALGAGTPTSFLRLRGAGTAARWRAFLGELERAEPSLAADDQRRACDVAVETFATFSDAFDALESHA